MQEQINDIKKDIIVIKENHLAHIEVDLAKISTNQAWLMRFFWIIATTSTGGLVANVINLIIK